MIVSIFLSFDLSLVGDLLHLLHLPHPLEWTGPNGDGKVEVPCETHSAHTEPMYPPCPRACTCTSLCKLLHTKNVSGARKESRVTRTTTARAAFNSGQGARKEGRKEATRTRSMRRCPADQPTGEKRRETERRRPKMR